MSIFNFLHIETSVFCRFKTNSIDIQSEISAYEHILKQAIDEYQIEGLLHGGIKSKFQKQQFENICNKLNIFAIAPLWESDPKKYMSDLLYSNFKFIITSVSSDGLDDSWLGKEITINDIETLSSLSEKFGFNLDFEGGEAETFVIDCPLFSYPIKINRGEKYWDGYRGRFEIVDAMLETDA